MLVVVASDYSYGIPNKYAAANRATHLDCTELANVRVVADVQRGVAGNDGKWSDVDALAKADVTTNAEQPDQMLYNSLHGQPMRPSL